MKKNTKFNRTYIIILLVTITKLVNAQNIILYDKEINVNMGMAVPTMTSKGFTYSPESIFYKASLTNFTSLQRGYSVGMQFNTISNLKEASIPLLFAYRSKPDRVIIPGTYNLTIPMNVILSAGANLGYVVGDVNDEIGIKLNRSFVGSFVLSARFCYLLGSISFFINPELRFLFTKNYSFDSNEGWKNPLSYFKGSFGLGYSF